VKIALIPGGPHQYFQAWKTETEKGQERSGLGAVTFDETSPWDKSKQDSLLNSLSSQGYKAFGVFGVSPTDINSTFIDLKARGAMVASLGSCPAGDTMTAGFCLSTDVGDAAYKATIDAMGGKGTPVHLPGITSTRTRSAQHCGRAEGRQRNGRQGVPARHGHRRRAVPRSADRSVVTTAVLRASNQRVEGVARRLATQV
jgi:ABC-type sugar transport system substrate-binding protein